MEASDSPSRSRNCRTAPLSAVRTPSLPLAWTCSSARMSPVTQSCALSVTRYADPRLAMVPPSSALPLARWQSSRPTSRVTPDIGSRPINRNVDCCCCSFSTFRNGDCRSCTASASLSVSSNIVSPVRFTKSASTTVSRSASAGVWVERHSITPPMTPMVTRGAAIHNTEVRRDAADTDWAADDTDGADSSRAADTDRAADGADGADSTGAIRGVTLPVICVRPLSVALRRRRRSARRSAALW
jgi:hypothetical protein